MANLFDYNIKRMISFRLLKGTEKTILGLWLGPIGLDELRVKKSHSAEAAEQTDSVKYEYSKRET